jgi:NAD(P)H-nitrite reductase large subunit
MTDTDRTALQAIHAAAEKAERDFYRSKGVTLPTEAAYTTMDANKQKIHTVIDALPASVRATLRPADDGKK